jgi:hypothetical protein
MQLRSGTSFIQIGASKQLHDGGGISAKQSMVDHNAREQRIAGTTSAVLIQDEPVDRKAIHQDIRVLMIVILCYLKCDEFS